MTVTVEEVKPATVSRNKAWRIVLGRLVVRFVESFAGSLIGVVLFMPANAEQWQILGGLLLQPAITSLYQALRSAWPAIKKWLESGGVEGPEDEPA